MLYLGFIAYQLLTFQKTEEPNGIVQKLYLFAMALFTLVLVGCMARKHLLLATITLYTDKIVDDNIFSHQAIYGEEIESITEKRHHVYNIKFKNGKKSEFSIGTLNPKHHNKFIAFLNNTVV